MGHARYDIIREVGSGGFGVAYEAHDNQTEERVCIKRCTFKNSDELQSAFREASAMAVHRHPCLVRVRAVELDQVKNDSVSIIMNFCSGGSLRDLMTSIAPMTIHPIDTISICLFVMYGLNKLHGSRCIHRDLKPDNIFISSTLRDAILKNHMLPAVFSKVAYHGVENDALSPVQVGDFGLATTLKSRISYTGSFGGTIPYLSPEAFRSETGRPSDIWAIGCIIGELLTGRIVFRGKDLPHIMKKVQSGTIPPLPRDVPKDLRALYNDCLSMDRKKRPKASNLVKRLQKLLVSLVPSVRKRPSQKEKGAVVEKIGGSQLIEGAKKPRFGFFGSDRPRPVYPLTPTSNPGLIPSQKFKDSVSMLTRSISDSVWIASVKSCQSLIFREEWTIQATIMCVMMFIGLLLDINYVHNVVIGIVVFLFFLAVLCIQISAEMSPEAKVTQVERKIAWVRVVSAGLLIMALPLVNPHNRSRFSFVAVPRAFLSLLFWTINSIIQTHSWFVSFVRSLGVKQITQKTTSQVFLVLYSLISFLIILVLVSIIPSTPDQIGLHPKSSGFSTFLSMYSVFGAIFTPYFVNLIILKMNAMNIPQQCWGLVELLPIVATLTLISDIIWPGVLFYAIFTASDSGSPRKDGEGVRKISSQLWSVSSEDDVATQIHLTREKKKKVAKMIRSQLR
ncbi:hypothetical protein ADUPG1_010433 [Aduncisulcus paluster]|uniref:non-specific serine/threonine protein kinase n=1 Tax=Aduncisulcus paluster TaxID=2918883 RepID=A0ABQ5JRD6_9EUKA|nr:hypothetical protein ADUPG1_010433 [Aduncisulcus paluster]